MWLLVQPYTVAPVRRGVRREHRQRGRMHWCTGLYLPTVIQDVVCIVCMVCMVCMVCCRRVCQAGITAYWRPTWVGCTERSPDASMYVLSRSWRQYTTCRMSQRRVPGCWYSREQVPSLRLVNAGTTANEQHQRERTVMLQHDRPTKTVTPFSVLCGNI